METQNHKLHIAFFPFMAQGHVIPAIHLTKLFVSRGLKATIITTPADAPFIRKKIENSGTQINIFTIKVPAVEVGLPENCENFHSATSPEMQAKFFKATTLLGPQLELFLKQRKPNCLVADMFFPWATDVASKLGIPTLIFHGISYFALCATLCVHLYKPHNQVSSDSEPFVIPNLPDKIELNRKKIPDFVKDGVENEFKKMYEESMEALKSSYGVLVNSFYELEHSYADHYRNVLGLKAWHIGPLWLCNEVEDQKLSTDEHECMKWLDRKKPNSVVYVCFGSLANFGDAQLLEIAIGLEASGHHFIWVVNKQNIIEENWLPEGFEERIEGKGMIIRGWAPQVKILSHEAVGGFVTHCGWNSTLEAVCAGVPMVTWPLFAEQFYNEKLITQVLGIGVDVGAQEWIRVDGEIVKSENIEKAVRKAMVGEKAEEMRSRARGYAEMARRAIEEGGSSYTDLNSLIEELRSRAITTETS
ncbi:PREDICTED: UDP-glucose flavonoid 3-O-glucosyltransferase 7-like [Fragaria vesca subsp. vesca]|uniref:UDP-glucose flavonoid 3-O-glucosyltransferase 7-like n=1 Tax=Fragaria vesca subsp. vesca TaxID=101020 RepID=UPI0002C3037C|nr:PREDICTED: UDP-glucose flavonoid 3-O-glucosyltransferase 7-like [Fragaria vesca subsp. vesca]